MRRPATQPVDDELRAFYDDILDRQDRGLALDSAQAAERALNLPPDRSARTRDLASRYGVPQPLVERDFDTWNRRATLDDLREIFESSTPELRSWLREGDNFAVAQDDLDNLAAIERQVSFGNSVRRGVQQMQSLMFSALEATGEAVNLAPLTELGREGRLRNIREAERYASALGLEDIRGLGDLGRFVVDAIGEQIPIMTPMITGGAAGAAVGSIVPGIGTALGGLIGAFVPALALGVGEVQQQVKDIDPAMEATGTAFIGGSAIAAFDTVLPGRIGRRLVRAFGLDAAEAIARRALVQKVPSNLLTRTARGTVVGMSTEGVTEALQEAIGEWSIAVGLDRPVTIGLWRQMLEAGAKGAVVGGVFGGGAATLERPGRGRRAEADAAVQGREFFVQVGAAAQKSTTLQRSLAAASSFIERVAGASGDRVYADVDTWTTYYQSKGLDPEEVASRVTGSARAYRDALESGTPIAIPTSRYITEIAATDDNVFWQNEMRLAPDLMNAREGAAFHVEQAQQAAARAEAEPEADRPAPPSGAEIERLMVDRLVAAGTPRDQAQTTASLLAETVANQARIAGVDPMLAFAPFDVQVRREGLRPAVQTAAAAPVASTPAPAAQTSPAVAEAAAAGAVEGEEEIPGLAALEAELEGLGIVERPDEPTEVGASGESAASLEAQRRQEGMQARGERFVVYDRAGRARPIIGPEAVDYRPQRGETFGVEGPTGFRVLEDHGGRVPVLTPGTPAAETVAPDAPRPDETRPASRQRRVSGVRILESRPSSRENEPSRFVRRQRGESDADLARRRDEFVAAARAERKQAHLDDLFASVVDAAREIDPTVDLSLLEREFAFRMGLYEENVEAYLESGQDPTDLLRAIAGYRGINTEDSTYPGEVRWLQEGLRFGAARGVNGVFRRDGLSIDDMLTSLRQDQRFAWIETVNDLIDAIDEAIRHEPIHSQHVYPGIDVVERDLKMDPDVAWWTDPWAPADQPLETTDDIQQDANEELLGTDADISFDVREFEQGLFDDVEPEQAAADILETGEAQPRLPEAGAVRETDQPTPEVADAPFALTPPRGEVGRRGRQQTLFQPLTAEQRQQFMRDLEQMRQRREAWVLAVVEQFQNDGIVRIRGRGDNVVHVIHRSTSFEGKFQITTFVNREPIGHTVADTIEAAARETLGGEITTEFFQPQIESAPIFYSQAIAVVQKKMPNRASAGQVLSILKNPQNGVKSDELFWTGLEAWLSGLGGEPVAKTDVLDFLEQNQVRLEETMFGDAVNSYDAYVQQLNAKYGEGFETSDLETDEATLLNELWNQAQTFEGRRNLETRYGEYTLPGGVNYRELLIRLPRQKTTDEIRPDRQAIEDHKAEWDQLLAELDEISARMTRPDEPRAFEAREAYNAKNEELNALHQQMVRETALRMPPLQRQPPYTGPHWQPENIIAHVRFNERRVRTYTAETIQSIERRLSGMAAKGIESRINKLLDTIEAMPGFPTDWTVTGDTEPNLAGQRSITVRDGEGNMVSARSGFRGTNREAIASAWLGREHRDSSVESRFDDVLRERTNRGFNPAQAITAGVVKRAVTAGVITPLEAAQYRHVRKLSGDTAGAEQRILFIEEIQSDWHQQGRRKGYRIPAPEDQIQEAAKRLRDAAQREFGIIYDSALDAYDAVKLERELQTAMAPETVAAFEHYDGLRATLDGKAVPDAPWKTTWAELAMKRMIRFAADHGFDVVAWTDGASQIDRYDLSKRVREITWIDDPRAGEGMGRLTAWVDEGTSPLAGRLVHRNNVEDFIGKELADRLLAAPVDEASGWRSISGVDLKVGGEGMVTFYDKMLPAFVKKYGKPWGVAVQRIDVPGATRLEDERTYSGPDVTHEQVRIAREEQDGSTFTIQLRQIDEAMSGGMSFKRAIELFGSVGLAERVFGGNLITGSQQVQGHGFVLPEAMKDRVVEEGQTLFQSGITRPRTEAFERFIEGTAVVDEQGEPLVVYHGTLRSFDSFAREQGNVESDFGAGFYFSNTPEDVEANYAGLGPDVTNKIEREAERLEGAYDYDTDVQEEVDNYAEAHGIKPRLAFKRMALERFAEHEGLTMPVYLSIKNPAIVGGPNETVLTIEREYEPLSTYDPQDVEDLRERGFEDEEIQIELAERNYYEPTESGTLVDFLESLRRVASRYDDGEVDDAIARIVEESYGESIPLSKAIAYLRDDERFNYFTDDEGNLVAHEIVRQALEDAGFDGIIDYTVDVKFGSQRRIGKSMQGMHPDTVHYIAFRPEQIKSAIGNRGTFDPASGNILLQDARGKISFGPGLSTTITLLEKADPSTFLHETGHFFLRFFGELRDHVAGLEERTPEQERLLEDFDEAMRFSGYESRERMLAMIEEAASINARARREGRDLTAAERARMAELAQPDETWARGFEAYLFEGKAPSVKLRRAFQRFRAWLIGVYRSINRLNVTLTPEIRGVFDRMIASEDAIREVEAQGDIDPLFLDPATVGMSPDEFSRYRDDVEAASRRRREILDAKLLAEVKREQQRQWREQRDAILKEEAEKVYRQPVYRALAAIRRGTHPDGRPLVPDQEPTPLRLSARMVDERFGPSRRKRLPAFTYVLEGGVDPRVVAEEFGFSSDDALLTAIEQAEPMAAIIRRETKRRMAEEHGDILLDGSLFEEAQVSVANDEYLKVLVTELTTLSRAQRQRARASGQVVRRGVPSTATLQQIARERVAGTRIRDLRPNQYWAIARKSAREAVDLVGKGDLDGAVKAKTREILNLEIFREAERVLADVDARTAQARNIAKPASRARLGKAGQGFLEAADNILERFEFVPTSLKKLDERIELRKWAQGLEATGQAVDLPESVLNEANRINYRELSVEEFIGVSDALRQIVHAARDAQTVMSREGARELAEIAEEIDARMRETSKLKPAKLRLTRSRGMLEKWRQYGKDLIQSFFNADTILRELDGFTDLGPLYRHVKGEIDRAYVEDLLPRTKVAVEKLTEINSVFRRGELTRQEWVPELNDSLTREELIAIALNTGSTENKEALLHSKKWLRLGIGERELQRILDRLEKRDWDYVQAVWDYLETFWPEIEASQRRRKGLAPKRVEAAPLLTRFGEYRGGYYPLKYDPEGSILSTEDQVEDVVRRMRLGRYAAAATSAGFAIERVGSGGRPVLLSLNVLTSHVNEVLYDLSLGDAVRYADRVLRNQRVRTAFEDTGTRDAYQMLQLWLHDVAAREIIAGDGLSRTFRWLRVGFTASALGFNMGTAAIQPAGIAQSMSVVGVGPMLRGAGDMLMRGWFGQNNVFRQVTEASKFMESRQSTFNKDISTAFEATQQGPIPRWVPQTYFWFITKSQWIVDVATWLGAHARGLEQFDGDTQKAVQFADRMVARSQASGLWTDRAAIERGTISTRARQSEGYRLWTTLASYMIAKWNVAYEKTRSRDLRRPQEFVGWLVDMSLLFAFEAMLVALIRGKFDDDDEFPGHVATLVKETGLAVIATMPFIREIGSEVEGFRGGGVLGNTAQRFGNVYRQIEQGDVDGALVRSVNSLGGVLFHYPASAINRVLYSLEQEQQGNDVELLDYLIYREND